MAKKRVRKRRISNSNPPFDPAILSNATESQRKVLTEYLRTGDLRQTARRLDVSESYISHCVARARKRSGMPFNEKFAPEANAKIRDLEREVEKWRRKHAAEKQIADEATKMNRDFLASQFEMKRQEIKKARLKGSFVRVAFGDTHGASIDPGAWNALLHDIEFLKPAEIIHGGDVLDCDGWLASHHTTHYVAQTSYSYADEVVAGNIQLDQLQAAAPNASIEILEGNHDARVETWAVTVTQKLQADAQLLLDAVGPRTMLNVDKRGIKWWSRADVHAGVIGGSVKKGKCWFTHGYSASKHAASQVVSDFESNVVYFHTHRRDYYPKVNAAGDERAAWCPGCICVKRKYWHHTKPFFHNQGYHVQFVQKCGTILGFNVPIINGVSMLADFGRDLV